MASNAGPRRTIPWRLLGWGSAAALLLVPLVAGFPWTLSDYVFAAVIFALVGGTFELAARKSGNHWYRGGVAVALGTAFLLVWINAAVGIIGGEGNPANLMFLGVIAIAVTGALVARFEPGGMAVAMAAAAAAEALVGVIVLVGQLGAKEPPGMVGVLVLIGFFAVTWLLSAWLFRMAARRQG
jgi:hypothetical protein